MAFAVSAAGFGLVFATASVPVITVGAVVAGLGTGMLLPTLLTWAVNRLDFAQRGRGTGVWTGSLFLGEFVCPLLIAAIGAGVGGLRPAIGVLGIVALVMAGISLLVTRRTSVALNVTNE
jgi:MFS family permease